MTQENVLMQMKALLSQMEAIDLSHPLNDTMPVWPTHAKFRLNNLESYHHGGISCHYEMTVSDHGGTHVDAPLHFIPSGQAHYGIEQVPLATFSGRAATLRADHLQNGELWTASHIRAWEKQHGSIEADDIVLIYFGRDVLWERPDLFLAGWPGISRDAAEYLAAKKVKMVGCDTLSLDASDSDSFPAHYTLLGNEVLIMENLNQLGRLPAFSYFFGFPLKIEGGSASPIRAVAYVPKGD